MTKQKFVVKLSLGDAKKRTKALKTAVTMNGIQSASLDGDKLVVIGDGTDAIILTTQLRKKLGYADLISVAEEKKEEKKEKENKSEGETKIVQPLIYPYRYTYPYPYMYLDGAYDHKFYSIL